MRKLLLVIVLGAILVPVGLSLATETCDQGAGDPVFIQRDRRAAEQAHVLRKKLLKKTTKPESQTDKSGKQANEPK